MFSIIIFFYKQKTAFEMRISDWSSDVCSSDLLSVVPSITKPGLLHGPKVDSRLVLAHHSDSGFPMTDAPHYEQQYLDLMRHVWTAGDERVDRTGVGTRSVFGATLRFSLADNAIPLLQTKRLEKRRYGKECVSTFRT